MLHFNNISDKWPFNFEDFLFQHDDVFMSLVWKNLTNLHRSLISALSNNAGMNRNINYKPDVITTTSMLNLFTAPTTEGIKSLQQVLSWKQKSEDCYSKRGMHVCVLQKMEISSLLHTVYYPVWQQYASNNIYMSVCDIPASTF